MFSDKWLSTKVGAKLLSDFIMFSSINPSSATKIFNVFF